MLLDWMDSCSCMVLWPPRAHRVRLYTCYIGGREWVEGQAHTRQSATVDEYNNIRPDRRRGRQGETAKPDITTFCDHQTQQHLWQEGRCCSNTALLGSLSTQTNSLLCWRNAKWSQQEPELTGDAATRGFTKSDEFVLVSGWDASHGQTWGHVAASASSPLAQPCPSLATHWEHHTPSSGRPENWRACICLQRTWKIPHALNGCSIFYLSQVSVSHSARRKSPQYPSQLWETSVSQY